ncbi:MAG: ketopantoate reductase family protein [Burkholderiales bacterium]|nr:ketopantoate reductase family protein [Burkholderiales bacterium]
MNIVVLGAGALGGAIGGVLAESGCAVTLVTRNAAQVDAIRRDGLRLVEDGRERRVAVAAATGCVGLAVAELVIVLVKSYDTRAAIASARGLVGGHTAVLSLQNGLGHEEVLAEVVGRDRVLAGKTYVGGVMLAPGRILVGRAGKETLIGELDGRVSPRALAIRDAFQRAGLTLTVSENIVGTMWDKLLVNVATGALSGITRLTYGELYRLPEVEACAVAAVAEAMAVARAGGVALATREPRDAWIKAAEGLPADFRTSMLQSLEKGAPTEIDDINGAVVRAGRRCGVATPVNQTLVAAIKGIEHRARLQAA